MKNQIALLFALMAATMLSANNITVSNISLTGQNTSAGLNNPANYAIVKFDIGWENSWRTSSAPYNWDAAWVFVKYRVTEANGGDGLWKQTWLNNAGHTAPTGSVIDIGLLDPSAEFNSTANPGLGAFFFRDADGTGSFFKTGVKLRWNYGANGVADGTIVDIQVFAIEMAYLPQGAFAVGSGGSETNAFTLTTINTGNATTVPGGTGSLGGEAGGYPTGQTAPTNAIWPNGYNAFYCMKYEISQQEYVDFLNSLTYTQQATLTAIEPNSVVNTYLYNNVRHKIKISTSGTSNTVPAEYATDYPYVGCNYLDWNDVAAYLAWSCLRPMTELEFEKTCRGTLTPVANEYAWGSTSLTQNTGITNPGANNEISTNNGNCTYGNIVDVQGPMRAGAFAEAASTRSTSGATYYGIMEMSGNLWDRPVTIANAAGRAFTGTNGDGLLSSTGYAQVTNWPGTDVDGAGMRGGAWNHDFTACQVSDRVYADYTYGDRGYSCGGRGVRSQKFYIGQSYGGGIIFYIGGSGQHGLIAATGDQGVGTWGCQGTTIPGTSTAIGTGQTNTSTIVSGCSEAAIAARLCDDLVLNGYSDWFLPSKDELNQMYIQKAIIGDFGWGWYWSSSEYSALAAWCQDFDAIGTQGDGGKNSARLVRAIRSFTTVPTVTTATISDITSSTATSGGNVTDDGGASVTARGVCWSTSANPILTGSHTTDGSGTGSFVSSLTSLNPNTLYYVRAYATSSVGTAYGDQMLFTNCGSSITINHVEGEIAPVNKTVTYGTVTGIPGEETKCWITSNLGADHQATAVTDNTEESAGWYWQFNRKQGYKTDGSTITPLWTITSIDENSDWQAANDPCALELGSGWRIPTQTEWENIDASGNWENNYGPWNSGLKLHQAGGLDENGGLSYPGEIGGYMSIRQSSNVYDWALYFDGGHCDIIERFKAYAHSLRCIR